MYNVLYIDIPASQNDLVMSPVFAAAAATPAPPARTVCSALSATAYISDSNEHGTKLEETLGNSQQ